ncbi:MAG: metallophosphoesterase family protein, partial [Candidatus Geothermincolia bacterium]
MLAHISDLHCGDPRFDAALASKVIETINQADPDLLVVDGDLTERGYLDQFEEAKAYLDRIECAQRIVIPGNHDERNVGYEPFEELFGPRYSTETFTHRAGPDSGVPRLVKVVSVDSNKPDLNEGEVGRSNYGRIREDLDGPEAFKIFVLHHHLISVPGTGRERNIVLDAGDVLATLLDCRVDMTLSGHKHVPYVWSLQGMQIVTSGTATTRRTRGFIPPSFNLIEVGEGHVTVRFIFPDSDTKREA